MTTEGLFGALARPVFALVSVVYQSQTDFEEPLEVGLNGSSCIALEFKCWKRPVAVPERNCNSSTKGRVKIHRDLTVMFYEELVLCMHVCPANTTSVILDCLILEKSHVNRNLKSASKRKSTRSGQVEPYLNQLIFDLPFPHFFSLEMCYLC